jgi:hypothetical protein
MLTNYRITLLCKQNGIESNFYGGWQHHALTGLVGSVSRIPIWSVLLNQQLPQIK